MKVIVTDGNNRAALAVTRSLGREGHEVIVGAEEQPCLASSSRFCSKKFVYPDLNKAPQGFIEKIRDIVEKEKPDVLMPISDITTMTITANKESLERFCTIPFPSSESINRAANKYTVMSLAKQLGIPIPRTVYLEGLEELESVISSCDAIGYPIVIKPSRSRIPTSNGWQATGVKYAEDGRELRSMIGNAAEEGYPLLLQERIYGPAVGLFLCIDNGTTIAAFSHRRLREKPPSGGVSVLRESIPLDARLKEQSEQLLKALNWQGVAMVEFKQDKRTDEVKLMEVNGRFWGSLQLAIDAGVNFPSILSKIAVEKHVTPIMEYKIGVKTRWFWGDMDVLLAMLFKTKGSLKLPTDYPNKWNTLLNFVKFWGKDLCYEVFDTEDINPWFFETRRWLLGK